MASSSEAESVGPLDPERLPAGRKNLPAQALQALRELYEELDGRIEDLAPLCQTSGRCCRFREFGHALFVTGFELELFEQIEGMIQILGNPERQERFEAGICPYQVDGLCSTREGRPIGCRVFFCDQSKEQILEDLAEEFHGRLRKLHEQHEVPYTYGPWLKALASRESRTERST